MKIPSRHTLQFWMLLLMPAGLLFSRILLSCSMIGFVALACVHPGIARQFRRLLQSPLLAGLTILFLVPLLSGVWSDDLQTWSGQLRTKLPLLLMPLAFAGDLRLTAARHRTLSTVFIYSTWAGTAWTFILYLGGGINDINDAYLRSSVMLTPMYDDHVRFSWMVSLAALLVFWLGADRWRTQRGWAFIHFLTGIWFMVFLHILSARTGLLSLYIMLFMGALHLMFRARNAILSLSLLVILLAMPLIAYYQLPSFHNRARIVIYEYDYFKHLDYLPGSNDAVRMISYKAGWELMRARPLQGSGFGDTNADAQRWYEQHYPQMQAWDRKSPGSEWILYGAGAGIPGFILFSLVMLLPFFTRTRMSWIWHGLNLTAAVCMLTDVGLEVQTGVALYVLMVCWWYSWLATKNSPSLHAV